MSETGMTSVVIPAFNAAKYLGEAIESVLANEIVPLQVIVVDDGSTDATAQVAQSFGSQVIYSHQSNGGIASALNRGLTLAEGKWIAFNAADDRWAEGRLEKQLAIFEANPLMDLVFGHVQNFFSPELTAEVTRRYYCPPEPLAGYSLAAMLTRRSTFERVGRFDTQYKLGEFVDWFARAKELGLRYELLPEIVVWRRLHGDNLSIRSADDRSDFVKILKASMDRRRQP
jgi:glycosyltransferase involved in cell wall biosynthesis